MTEFTWKDGERWIVFRHGALRDGAALLREHGWDEYELLSTPRALETAPAGLEEAGAATHAVPAGPVPEAAAAIFDEVDATSIVALGGGRVIDAAKAIAAVRGGRVCAIPTTLSGAPMTSIHRLPGGQEADRLVRPALVLADPGPMTELPEQELRATAMNALAHGAEALYGPLANPVAEMAGLRGASSIAVALDQDPARRDRAALALGAILCGYAVGSAGFALHHVLGQTTVRVCAVPHAGAYAALLPHTVEGMRDRAPEMIAALAGALGTTPEAIGERIDELAGHPPGLGELGADRDLVGRVVEVALERPELKRIPDPPSAAELEAILDSSWQRARTQ
ncbi:MAG TPA: iron-containing alcohol dehydrogenase [Solirubrobacterales bacterium]|nr:iron-containing alcohol dehydrogenase [Solirubrobacterales bacterium]